MGYIYENGEVAIQNAYHGARSFSDGFAGICIKENEKKRWGFIDDDGKFVIQPQFESVGDFSEGLAPVAVSSPYFRLDPEDYRDKS